MFSEPSANPADQSARSSTPGRTRRTATLVNVPAFATDDVLARFHQAYALGARLSMRQSSERQARFNRGSGWSQEAARNWVRLYGLDPSQIYESDARGESGRRGKDRPEFMALAKDAKAGRFGVLILPMFDRVGRHMAASCGLFDALLDVGGFVIAERRLFDLKNPNDMADLRERANDAERQNEHRRLRMMGDRLQLAQHFALRGSLPVGLCWAVTDHVYRAALVDTGRDDLVEVYDQPDLWAVWSETSLGTMRPVWFPDAGVIRACELRLQWFRESGRVRSVINRIQSDEEWPTGRRGMIPYIGRHRWRPGLTVQWLPVIPAMLRYWLGNPSLYGIFAFSTGTKDPGRVRRDPTTATIFEYDMFPAYAPSSEYASVHRALAQRTVIRRAAAAPNTHDRPNASGSETTALKEVGEPSAPIEASNELAGERRAEPERGQARMHRVVLPRLFRHVRCGYRLSDDTVCAYALVGTTTCAKDPTRLRSSRCLARGHTSAIDYRMTDRFLLDVVGESLESGRLAAIVNGATLASDTIARELARLHRESQAATALLSGARRSEDAAHARREVDDVEAAKGRQKHYKAELKRINAAITSLEVPRAAAAELLEADIAHIQAAVQSARAALLRAYEAPDIARRVLEACVDVIYVRRVSYGTYEVDADFHSGETVRRKLRLKPTGYPQPQCAFIHATLEGGTEPTEVLRMIAECELRGLARGAPLVTTSLGACAAAYEMWEEVQRDLLTESDTGTAAPSDISHPLARQSAAEWQMFGMRSRIGPRLSLEQLVALTGADYRDILRAAVSGVLGPGVSEGGMLWLVPTLGEIHHAVPAYAARAAEREAGWGSGDAIPIQAIGILLPTRSTALSLPSHALRNSRDPRAGYVVTDASGRIFVRRGSRPALVLDAFQRAVLESDRSSGRNDAARAMCYWRAVDLASAMLHVSRALLLELAPSITFQRSAHYLVQSCTVVWLGPDVRAELARCQLRSVAERANVAVNEYRRVADARTYFAAYEVKLSIRAVLARAKVVPLGQAVSLAEPDLRLHDHIHIPAAVWDCADGATMAAWIKTIGKSSVA